MITLTYTNEVTGYDATFQLSVKEHTPLDEKRHIAIADAGDYIDPDIIYKGSSTVSKLTTNAIASSRIDEFELFKLHTRKREFTVDATAVPLVGVEYVAIRLGNLMAKSIHGGRFFYFALDMRVVRVDP